MLRRDVLQEALARPAVRELRAWRDSSAPPAAAEPAARPAAVAPASAVPGPAAPPPLALTPAQLQQELPAYGGRRRPVRLQGVALRQR